MERKAFAADEPTEPSPHQIPVSWIGPVRVRIVCGLLFATHDPRAPDRYEASACHPASRNQTEGKNVVMTALIETSSDRWKRVIRSTGVVGLVTFVVVFAALIASTPGEPPFLASPQEALAFYLNTTAGWVQASMAVLDLAAIGWIWFVVGLCLLLARAEGSPPWRSAVALVCGVILGAFLLLNTSGNAASFGAADLDLAVASYAFDVSSLGLANIWLALGSFAACSGWVVLSTRVVGRWLGWWGIASGLGLVLARFFWTSMIWLLPYAAFWIWMIIMCIQLVRKPGALLRAAEGRASPGGE